MVDTERLELVERESMKRFSAAEPAEGNAMKRQVAGGSGEIHSFFRGKLNIYRENGS